MQWRARRIATGQRVVQEGTAQGLHLSTPYPYADAGQGLVHGSLLAES